MTLPQIVDPDPQPPAGTVSSPATASVGFGRIGRILAWFGVVLLALYMTVGEGSGWYGVYSALLRTFSVGALAGVFGVWALVAWRSPAWRPRSTLWLPIVVGLAAYVVATIASWNPRISLEYTAYAVLLAGLYLLLLRLLASPFFRPRLFTFAALLCTGICLWYVWTVFGLWAELWGLIGRFTIPPLRPAMDGLSWRSPNTVAIMVILLLPPVLAWYGGGTRRKRVLLAALTLLTLFTVLLAGSRGAWLGFGVALVATVVMWLAIPGHVGLLRQQAGHLPIGRVPAAVLALAVIAAGGMAAAIALTRAGGGGEDLRADLLSNALRVFQTDPLTGSGPGTWVVRRIAFTEPQEQDYYIPHAHNVFGQTAAEFGVAGIIAGVVIIGWLFALIWSAVRDIDPVRRRFGWASLFSAIYLGVHQLVDLYVGLPCVLFAFALSVGYLDVTSPRSVLGGLAGLVRRPRLPDSAGKIGRALLGVGVVVSLAFLSWSESAALRAEDAIGSANAGDWTAALQGARAARAADSDMPAYAFIVGVAALHTGDLRLAADALAVSVAADDFPEAWLNLAAARIALGDPAGATAALQAAMRVGGQQPSVAFGAGAMYQQLGDPAAATRAFAAAISGAPTLFTDPWFAATGPAGPLRDAILTSLRAPWTATAWDSELLIGDAAGAEIRAEQLQGSARDRALLVIHAWNGEPGALAALVAAARASPSDTGLVGWTARVELHAGNTDAARRYARWASIIVPGGGDLAQDVRVTSAGETGHGFGGIDPSVYGLYAYRRAMPADLLAPTIPHLQLVAAAR